MSLQKGQLKRRVVSQITEYYEPKQIFSLITQREWDYTPQYQKEYGCRDRALMSLAFCSGGRITAIVGGPKYERQKGSDGKSIAIIVGEYPGLNRENINVSPDFIRVTQMTVVKRKRKTIKKYGKQVTIRDELAIPLKSDLFGNPYWDQLIPFGWLIIEYLNKYLPEKGALFRFKRGRAWQIINTVTDMYPNWFRAQAEHFYGHYLLSDSVKLAKFLKIVRPEQTATYIGYSWKDQLKDSKLKMDFDWIENAVKEIKKRLEG